MKRLSTSQLNERDRLVRELAESETKLLAAIESHEQAIYSANSELGNVLEAHNDLIRQANELKAEVANGIADYMADRADKWRDGKADRYRAWEDAWLDDIDPIEIDLPEVEGEELELDTAQRLKDLPEQPENAK